MNFRSGNRRLNIDKKMKEIKETGGARIGMANATWPLATLKVSEERLEINAGIVGKVVFRPSDVLSLSVHKGFSRGIEIKHRVQNYKSPVIFWTYQNPEELLKRIVATGILENKTAVSPELESEIQLYQSGGAFPVRWPVAISIVVLWNVFWLMEILKIWKSELNGVWIGKGSLWALGIVLLTCMLVLWSGPARKILLKKGRTAEDVKATFYFILLVCGTIFLSLLFL